MADDEQFSLCWNNFNSNLSAGFHESLCRGDLVDVTLAAEGQLVKAHRLVLSVCSPYFRKMFTQMPANQHAFVFLKDVSHSALKDLIQFMYCGEVNVKQDALPAFISTAEALQIKGLTDGEPAPSQSPAKPSTPAPQSISGCAPLSMSSPSIKSRSNRIRTYRVESEDSGDDKRTQQSNETSQTTQSIVVQKRPAQRSITPHTALSKRMKTDPLEAADPTQITVQTVSSNKPDEPEFIDLPIDIPTKSEPEYADDTGEVDEGGEQETAYVEDDSYGEMKYDESYFTTNDDGGAEPTTSAAIKPGVSGSFNETFVSDSGDQSTEAQGLEYIYSQRGRPLLVVDNYLYRKNRNNYWRCIRCTKYKCKSRLIIKGNAKFLHVEKHTHGPETEKINWGRSVKTTIQDLQRSQKNKNNNSDKNDLEFIEYEKNILSVKVPIRQPHFNTDSNF